MGTTMVLVSKLHLIPQQIWNITRSSWWTSRICSAWLCPGESSPRSTSWLFAQRFRLQDQVQRSDQYFRLNWCTCIYFSLSALKRLNRQFKVETVKKPPPVHIASTLIAEAITNNVCSRNGPRTIQNQISRQNGIKIPRWAKFSLLLACESLIPITYKGYGSSSHGRHWPGWRRGQISWS